MQCRGRGRGTWNKQKADKIEESQDRPVSSRPESVEAKQFVETGELEKGGDRTRLDLGVAQAGARNGYVLCTYFTECSVQVQSTSLPQACASVHTSNVRTCRSCHRRWRFITMLDAR